jgi:hypothetical protein
VLLDGADRIATDRAADVGGGLGPDLGSQSPCKRCFLR